MQPAGRTTAGEEEHVAEGVRAPFADEPGLRSGSAQSEGAGGVPVLRPDEIEQFAELAEETRAATNSHLLDMLAAIEIARAGRLSGQRKASGRKSRV